MLSFFSNICIVAMVFPTGMQYSFCGLLLIYSWIKGSATPSFTKAALRENENLALCFKYIFFSLLIYLLAIVLAPIVHNEIENFSLSLKKGIHLLSKSGLYFLFLSLMVLKVLTIKEGAFKVGKFVAIALLVHAMYMLVQRYTGIDIASGLNAKIPEHRFAYGVYRPSGLTSHPMTISYASALGALYFLFLLKKLENKKWILLCFSSMVASLLLSETRWAIACFVGVVGLFELRRIVKPKLLLILGVVLGFVLLEGSIVNRFTEAYNQFRNSENLEETFPRVLFWRVHREIFLDSPVVGSGYYRRDVAKDAMYEKLGFAEYEKKFDAHNLYLQTLADSGLVGLLGLLTLFAMLFHLGIREYRQDGTTFFWKLLVFTVLGALTQNTLRDSEVTYVFWLAITLRLAHDRIYCENRNLSGN